MYKIEDIANYFLAKESMTPKKLQKILFYAYSWFLTIENESVNELENRLFENKFEAWVHGPVVVTIYQKYKDYGFWDIPKYKGDLTNFPESVISILDEVWEVYGAYSGHDLESITHREDPWKKARIGCDVFERSNHLISDTDIYKYYTAQMLVD